MQRNKSFLLLFALWASKVSVYAGPSHNASPSVCERASAILFSVEQFHWSPVAFDDSLSSRVFQLWIEGLDPLGEYFTRASMVAFEGLSADLVSRLRAGDCGFVDDMAAYLSERLVATLRLTQQLTSYPLDYQREDFLTSISSYHLNADSAFWADRWRRRTKSQVLDQVYWWRDTLEMSEEALYVAFLAEEPQWRNQWLAQKQCRLERMAQPDNIREQVSETLLQALAQAFDPHTVYFSPQERQAFEDMLTPDSRSFGLELGKNRQGSWVIEYLLPGGSALGSGLLEEEDEVLEVQLGKNPTLDLGCMEEAEVAYALVVTEEDSARIKVRKPEGAVVEVTLERGHLRLQETTMEAYLLKGNTQVGYIRLPSFYTSYENEDLQGCAEDVSREVIRLQSEGMEGLVLDLRDNGGGSLQEALSLAGIFINYGPLTLETGRGTEPVTLRDWHRGTIFQGPVVVLVNGGSASASEILAATLQDWNKALIVGSPTYGKATGQVIVPAGVAPDDGSSYLRQLVDGEMGFLKVTASAFFRLNGEAYQVQGVLPDIVIAHPWDSLYPKEREDVYALDTRHVDKQVYFTPLSMPRESLVAQSKKRIHGDSTFNLWAQYAREVGESTAVGTRSPLRWPDFLASESKWIKLFSDIEKSMGLENEHFSVENLKPIQRKVSLDERLAGQNALARRRIQEDPVLGEAYWVIEDWLGLESK
ncbi:MAG TPA: hypothetical protein DCE41_21010 [Cytophagales bacterium]|nr:hypothetical protein [Cytophagales bacterium]HAA23830.1 hypothetical protein [Cytophagales bacterium]HAP59541.1 hypothetical protein [Cytophagales bacterium]